MGAAGRARSRVLNLLNQLYMYSVSAESADSADMLCLHADEELLDVTDAFRALRDGIPTSDPDIESRRDIYAVREVPGPHPAMGRPKRVR